MLLLANSALQPSNQLYFVLGVFVLTIWGTTRFYVFSMDDNKKQNLWMMIIVPFVIPFAFGLLYTVLNFYVLTPQKPSDSFWSQAGLLIGTFEFLVFLWGIITWNNLKKGESGGLFTPSLGESRHLKKLVEKMFIIPIILIVIAIGVTVFSSK
jgi:hypothetical protein